MIELNNRKILLFTSQLFNYHLLIKKELEKRGATVHLYDERNNPSAIEKILLRKASFLMRKKINNYYLKVIEIERSFNPDYVVFISPEAVSLTELDSLKAAFPESQFILYMWDSVENKHAGMIVPFFDKRYSFDPEDCKRYNMHFRPLFYSEESNNNQYKYDVGFIGTVHSDRAKVLYQVKEFCDSNGLSSYFYLFIPGKLLYTLRMATDPYLRKWDKSMVHISPIPKENFESIQSSIRCAVDINHPKQVGLTMRTIEMLGLKRKMITTNGNIKTYDFYRPQNQIVFNRKLFSLSKEMIMEDYVNIPESIRQKYSLDAWIEEIFCDRNTAERAGL